MVHPFSLFSRRCMISSGPRFVSCGIVSPLNVTTSTPELNSSSWAAKLYLNKTAIQGKGHKLSYRLLYFCMSCSIAGLTLATWLVLCKPFPKDLI